jgi:hypothetical protein
MNEEGHAPGQRDGGRGLHKQWTGRGGEDQEGEHTPSVMRAAGCPQTMQCPSPGRDEYPGARHDQAQRWTRLTPLG